MPRTEPQGRPDLLPHERRYFRDLFRRARYAALADAEGFHSICYALEELGCALRTEQGDLGKYEAHISRFVQQNLRYESTPGGLIFFSSFDPLYKIVRHARNDAMHTGAYARRVTSKATELCLLLEDALMNGKGARAVGDYMVREPVAVEEWQPVSRARQLMLTHSFSNLPVRIDGVWWLITEMGMAKYILRNKSRREEALGASIKDAMAELALVNAADCMSTTVDADVETLLQSEAARGDGVALWLVLNQNELVGVISAFELM